MSDERVDGDPELERQLDAMFGSLRPRAEFDDRLRQRLRPHRWWSFEPALLWVAAVIPVLILGFALLTSLGHPGGHVGASSVAAGAGGSRAPQLATRACPASPALSAETAQPLPASPPTTPSPTPSPCR